MIHVCDNDTKSRMFITNPNISFLCQAVHLFHCLPKPESAVRNKMYGHLQDICVTYGLTLDISHSHRDIEITAHEVARQLWPNIIIKACQFHLAQLWD